MQVNWSLKKMLASSALALFAVSNGYAIPRGPCEPSPKDTCCEEPKPGPFAFAYPKDMNLSCPRDFYFRADFLAMQPKEDGLAYALTDSDGPPFTQLTGGVVQSFSSEHHSWDWDFGFRVGMGFYLNHDAWNIDFQWMWFQVSEDVSSAVTGNGVIIPQWLSGSSTAPVIGDGNASARWHMSMNVFDVVMAKSYHVSRYLVLSPFFGLRGAWIDQDYSARYGGFWNSTINGAQMDASNDWWGVGTRLGMNSEWNLGSGWQLLGNISASMLYGKFNIDQTLPLGNLSYAVDDEFYRDNPNMEFQVGVAWGTHFNDMKHYVKLQVMWEFMQWFDQNWMRKFSSATGWVNDTVSRGDLTLSGVSGRIAFDF